MARSFRYPGIIARRRIKQFLHEAQMVRKVIAPHEFVRGGKPHSGPAVKLARMGPGNKFLASAMGAGRLDGQDRRDFLRAQCVADEPQTSRGAADGRPIPTKKCPNRPPQGRRFDFWEEIEQC
jgi:hypothetical protein